MQTLIPDSFTKGGAQFLAEKISAYWLRRGVPVLVWVEPIEPGAKSYCVRSNIGEQLVTRP